MNLSRYLFLGILLLTTTNIVLSQNLDVEADEQYKGFLEKTFLKYDGNDYIIRGQDLVYLYEINNIKTTLTKNVVTDVEFLNGIEWKGVIDIQATASRSIYWCAAYWCGSSSGLDYHDWEEWISFDSLKILLVKKRGTWRITNQSPAIYGVKADLSIVKQALTRPMRDQ